MSAICQHLETAFVRFLIHEAGSKDKVVNSFGLATHAHDIEVVPTGLLVTMDDGVDFTLSIYSGVSEDPVKLPAIVVRCEDGQRMDDTPNIQTCQVTVELETNWDSKAGFDSVTWTDQAARWLHGTLSGQMAIAGELEIAHPGLVISYVSFPECGRSVEGRRRLSRWALEVVASI
jgi:hypothetical protein